MCVCVCVCVCRVRGTCRPMLVFDGRGRSFIGWSLHTDRHSTLLGLDESCGRWQVRVDALDCVQVQASSSASRLNLKDAAYMRDPAVQGQP